MSRSVRALVGVLGVVFLVGCDLVPAVWEGEGAVPDPADTDTAVPRYTVTLATVTRADLEMTLDFVGALQGQTQVDVVPDVAGRLEAVHVQLGDRVQKGQPVAQIRTDDLTSQVRQAEHAHEVARATARQRAVDLTLAETTRDRSQRLFEQGLIARDALDDAQTRAAGQEAQLALAEAQDAQNGARLDQLRMALADATIRSPVDGFVASRNLDPGAFASTNTPIFSVVDIRRVKLVASLVERDYRRVWAGAPTVISVDAYPFETFDGVVARVAPVLDSTNRTAEIEVEIPNTDARLKPGMYARVEVTAERRQHALVVPRNALVSVGGAQGVFTLRQTEGSSVAVFVPVEVGLLEGELVEVLAGLSEGQEVITTGASGLVDGDPVTVLRERGDEASS